MILLIFSDLFDFSLNRDEIDNDGPDVCFLHSGSNFLYPLITSNTADRGPACNCSKGASSLSYRQLDACSQFDLIFGLVLFPFTSEHRNTTKPFDNMISFALRLQKIMANDPDTGDMTINAYINPILQDILHGFTGMTMLYVISEGVILSITYLRECYTYIL